MLVQLGRPLGNDSEQILAPLSENRDSSHLNGAASSREVLPTVGFTKWLTVSDLSIQRAGWQHEAVTEFR